MRSPRESRLAREDGMTLVEVLVAALIFVIGSLAILEAFDASARSAYRAEQSQVLNSVVQRELEEVRRLDYSQVALASSPASQTAENDPRHRVSGTQFALNPNGTGAAEMVVSGGGLDTDGDGQLDDGTVTCGSSCLAGGPEPFTSGDVSGQIYRFVVWQDDLNCAARCPGTQDLKRIVVAARLDGVAVSAERPYHETQSDLIDQLANAEANLPPPGNPPVSAEQFYLSDTTCDQPSRVAITADHDAHNTLGVCSDGLQTGAVAGAPDTLLGELPPPEQTELYDFSADLEPAVNPSDDRGLQLERPPTNGCEYAPSGAGAHHQIHRWVTAPMPINFVLEGDAELELYTRALNDAVHPGKICVFLFRRETTIFGAVEDTLLVDANGAPNQYFTHTELTWPHSPTPGTFGQITPPLSLEFDLTLIPKDQSLGVAIAIERADTPAEALEFAYDHPGHPSRLEVQTATPLP